MSKRHSVTILQQNGKDSRRMGQKLNWFYFRCSSPQLSLYPGIEPEIGGIRLRKGTESSLGWDNVQQRKQINCLCVR